MLNTNNHININGIEYGWSNITCLVSGTLLTSITAISYEETQTVDNIYGIGAKPVSIGYGNFEYSASITIKRSELIGLQASAKQSGGDPFGSLQSILPFTIIVSYARPDQSGITTDILNNCSFTAVSSDNNQGDTSLDIVLPLRISGISWNKI